MRIRFERNYQRKLLYKLKGKISWIQFAKNLNTKPYILQGCAILGNTLPDDIYDKIRTKETDRFIIDILDDNWGKIKGGKNSPGSTKQIKKPVLSRKLAELVGILLGDGSSYKNIKKGVYQVRIAGNIHNEQKYFSTFLKPSFEEQFHIKGRIAKQPKNGAIYLCFDSRELVEFLDSIGVPYNKIKRTVGIPNWIKKQKNFLISCIRGLIDTDGSIHRLSKRDPGLMRISFKNMNMNLLSDVRLSFLQLGFHPSKFIHNQIFLTRKSDIKLFVNKIGFNNSKNIERFMRLSPVV